MPSQNWMGACGSFALGLRTVGGGALNRRTLRLKHPGSPIGQGNHWLTLSWYARCLRRGLPGIVDPG